MTEQTQTPGQTPRRARGRHVLLGWVLPVLLVLGWLAAGGVLGPLSAKLGDVADKATSDYLPASAESSQVLRLDSRFSPPAMPAIVVYSREGGLTAGDRAAIRADVGQIDRRVGDSLTRPPVGPVVSRDGQAAQVVVPFAGSDPSKVTPHVAPLRDVVRHGGGLHAYVTGPAGTQADLGDALGGIDGMLIVVTCVVILVILLLVYRSPLLPFLVLAVAGTALGVAQGVVYLLAKNGVLSMGSAVQGIFSVLVLGVATDYALLVVSRYREELRRHEHRADAMGAAWRSSLGPIVASASTVALGLLCLLVSDLGLNRDLGPVGAIGVGCALLAMTTFLPGLLLLFGRATFWPFRPAYGSRPTEEGGPWARIARRVDRRPRLVWVVTALGLGVLALGVVRLDASGLSTAQTIVADDVGSKVGQTVLADHFPAGAGNPAIVVTRAGALPRVVAAARHVDGVDTVTPFTGGASASKPLVKGGLARVDVTMDASPDSDAAAATVQRLRDRLHTVPGARAKVGGYTAVQADFNASAKRDRIVMPLLLGVVLVVLALLLRALVAPLLLVATVVLSFLAALGVSGVVFTDVLGFAGADSTYPIHAFVFLVALGVDYNIFLMTRVREETPRVGTRQATLTGLALTGGVITSAGVVLAATFSALAVIPLVLLVELAFTIAFGVLLDTFVVRTLLVPALALDVGRGIWWPGRLARRERTPAHASGHTPERAADGAADGAADRTSEAAPDRASARAER